MSLYNKSLIIPPWIGVIFLVSYSFAVDYGFATEPTNHEPSASSIIDKTLTNGRIGGYQYDGSLAPTPGQNSRFANDAVYGSSGNIVGVNTNSSFSRFSQTSTTRGRFQSKMDFSIIALRNELQRTSGRMESGRSQSRQFDSGAPRLVTATRPERLPYSYGRRPKYGKTADDSQILSPPNQSVIVPFNESIDSLEDYVESRRDAPNALPQRLWMRERGSFINNEFLPQNFRMSNSELDNRFWDDRLLERSAAFEAPLLEGVFNSELGGGLQLPEQSGNVVTFPSPVQTPEEIRIAFQEYLELQLLRNPDVNPLSPIQVDFQEGVATIRGVVPTPRSRLIAGNTLLADPRVVKVNNMLTYVRNDEEGILPAFQESASDNLK